MRDKTAKRCNPRLMAVRLPGSWWDLLSGLEQGSNLSVEMETEKASPLPVWCLLASIPPQVQYYLL